MSAKVTIGAKEENERPASWYMALVRSTSHYITKGNSPGTLESGGLGTYQLFDVVPKTTA